MMARMKQVVSITAALFLASFLSVGVAIPAEGSEYEVTVYNLTRGTLFTPLIIVSHKKGVKLFTLGEPASSELEDVAEMGDTSGLQTLLGGNPKVNDITTTGPIPPGGSVTGTVDAKHGFNRLSLASMLLPTNDGFLALNGARAPSFFQKSVTYFSPGYDAGTEVNDEKCESIPGGGPCDGGTAGDDEGFVGGELGLAGGPGAGDAAGGE